MRAKLIKADNNSFSDDAMEAAGRIIRLGGLVAFPTETVYGLGGDALNPQAAKKIYKAKGRPSDNPLIIHIASWNALDVIASDIPQKAKKLAHAFWPGPLTIIFKKGDAVPKETTGGLDTVAVRFPSNIIAQRFIHASGGFVAAPSANISGRPSPTKSAHVIEDLSEKIDMIIDGGDCDIGIESTIVDFTSDIPVILRPGYISLEQITKVIGEINMDAGIVSSKSPARPKAPGMKYRHYAPKGDLTVIEGEKNEVTRKINSLIREKTISGIKCAVLCSRETRNLYSCGLVIPLGSFLDEDEIASHLFEALRRLDEEGAECIYSESFDTKRIGIAIMNRLLKAAGHKVIKL